MQLNLYIILEYTYSLVSVVIYKTGFM